MNESGQHSAESRTIVDAQESEFSYDWSSVFLTDGSGLSGDAVHHDLRP